MDIKPTEAVKTAVPSEAEENTGNELQQENDMLRSQLEETREENRKLRSQLEEANGEASRIRHNTNNIIAVLSAAHDFVEHQIEEKKLDLGKDGADSLKDIGNSAKRLRDMFMNPETKKVMEMLNAETAKKSSVKVLVVDDDEGIRRVIPRIFSQINTGGSGCRFEIAASADSVDDAMAKIKAGLDFDVILSDIMMPMKTGKDFADELEKDDGTKHLTPKMVFMSGGIDTRHPDAEALSEFAEVKKAEGRLISKPDDITDVNRVRSCISALLAQQA